MKAIVIHKHGGPENLVIRDLPDPDPKPGHVIIQVKAFGVNHAEMHMRQGHWPENSEVSGIECVGLVSSDPKGRLAKGQKVMALMGGMGRTIHGSYAEYTNVPATNVVPIQTDLPWHELAALPESYATAWTCLYGNLELRGGQTLLIRGATSALGQAAVNIAAGADARVLATTRNRERFSTLEALGARHALLEGPDLSRRIRERHPEGVDAVLDLVGNSAVLDSLLAVRRGGRVCEAGWLGGLAPIASFNPMLQMPSGVHFSLFGSFVFGQAQFPLSEVPLQAIVERVAAGRYKAKPAKVFHFSEIQEAHRLMESNQANGKIVVSLD
jgi:NADPH:quinone reductase-like Zn-dependent oxidoreductase